MFNWVLALSEKYEILFHTSSDFSIYELRRYGFPWTMGCLERITVFRHQYGRYSKFIYLMAPYLIFKTRNWDLQILHQFVSLPTRSENTIYKAYEPIASSWIHVGPKGPLLGRIERIKLKKAGKVVCNSEYARSLFRDRYGLNNTCVIHPPSQLVFKKYLKKRNTILTIGAFQPRKNFDLVLKIARKLPEYEFWLVGRMRARDYYLRISHNRPKNVKVFADIPFEKLKELILKAKVYLNTAKKEEFGMSVVQAMSGGCVPVVYAEGGPFEDIVCRGEYGLYYKTPEVAADLIKDILSNKGLFNEYSDLAKERSKDFGFEPFKEKLLNLVTEFV